MNFQWSEEARLRMGRAHEFAADPRLGSGASGGFNRVAWRLCAENGITGLMMPVAWGGSGCDALTVAGVLEALGRGGMDRGLLFSLGAHVFGFAAAFARFGTQEQQARIGAGLSDGSLVAALAITEAEGGSSLAMSTSARESAGGYILNGGKSFVTNGADADWHLVVASTHPQRGAMGLTAFLVSKDAEGLTVEPLPSSLGLAEAPMARVTFRDVAVPASSVLGKVGGGLAVLSAAMQYERTCILAGFLGAAERDLALCVHRMSSRVNAGGALIRHQVVAHRLARMKTRLESARWLLYRGAWALDHAKEPLLTPAMVKLTLSEALTDCALEVLQLFGGAGWLDEGGVATALRDVLGTLTASGTSDVQLNVIASCLSGEVG